MENLNTAILYGVPKIAYGPEGCTPFPMCIRSCANYLGIPTDYTRAMAESGAAFRLVWDTSCWNGGNVDAALTYDNLERVFRQGMRSMERGMKMLERRPETKKKDFIDFCLKEIDNGNPVIALGIIGPPEACIITGYRDSGLELMGWNVFQDYPESQTSLHFEKNGYFATKSWWENPETKALFAIGSESLPAFTPKEALLNAAEALEGRLCGTYAKGLLAYDAWRNALLRDEDFPSDAVFPILVERMMCHGDAMDCLSDGRFHAAKYLHRLAAQYPSHAEKLNLAAQEFENVTSILWKEMIPILGGWERGESQICQLAKAENRRLFAGQIDRMKAHDTKAYTYICELAVNLT